MNKILCSLFLVLSMVTVCPAESKLAWQTDLTKAKVQAAKENKLVLANFTGSDWCPACKLLDKGVLSKPTFVEYAKSNLVLVIVDFPAEKELPEAQRTANEALQKAYKVDGYPTVIVFNSDGKEISRDDGYAGESASEYVDKLKKLAAKK